MPIFLLPLRKVGSSIGANFLPKGKIRPVRNGLQNNVLYISLIIVYSFYGVIDKTKSIPKEEEMKNQWAVWEIMVKVVKVLGIALTVFIIGGLVSLALFPL
jgi:hypothetical protein